MNNNISDLFISKICIRNQETLMFFLRFWVSSAQGQGHKNKNKNKKRRVKVINDVRI